MAFPCFAPLNDGLIFLEKNILSPVILFHWKEHIKQEAETLISQQRKSLLNTLKASGGK